MKTRNVGGGPKRNRSVEAVPPIRTPDGLSKPRFWNWANWAITPGLFLLVFSRVTTLPKFAPDGLLDSSYGAALTYFRSAGLQFGTDAVYNFGPLGYLITLVFTGHAWPAQWVGSYLLAIF